MSLSLAPGMLMPSKMAWVSGKGVVVMASFFFGGIAWTIEIEYTGKRVEEQQDGMLRGNGL